MSTTSADWPAHLFLSLSIKFLAFSWFSFVFQTLRELLIKQIRAAKWLHCSQSHIVIASTLLSSPTPLSTYSSSLPISFLFLMSLFSLISYLISLIFSSSLLFLSPSVFILFFFSPLFSLLFALFFLLFPLSPFYLTSFNSNLSSLIFPFSSFLSQLFSFFFPLSALFYFLLSPLSSLLYFLLSSVCNPALIPPTS